MAQAVLSGELREYAWKALKAIYFWGTTAQDCVAELVRWVELIPVTTMADAVRVLERNGDLSVVICGVYFDESRMHDLLRCVRSRFSKVPFVCVRVLDAELPRVARDAIEIAARTLGAAAFIDFPNLVAQRGEKEAEEELRRAVLAQAKGLRAEKPTVARQN